MATTLGNGKRFGSPMMTAASKRAENRTIENLRFNMQSTDRKSTRLNSSHDQISYAVFCLKKKKRGSLRQADLLIRARQTYAGLATALVVGPANSSQVDYSAADDESTHAPGAGAGLRQRSQ